jgi:hypothetical protein
MAALGLTGSVVVLAEVGGMMNKLYPLGALVLGAACALWSTATSAESKSNQGKTPPSTAKTVQPTATTSFFKLRAALTPAVRAKLRAKLQASASRPDASRTAPLVKFVAEDTGERWGLIAGMRPLLYYPIINAGTATLPKETAIVNWEAVDSTGQSVAITEQEKAVPKNDLRVGQAELGGSTVRFVDSRDLRTVPFRSLPTFVLWITGAPNDGKVAIYEPDYVQKVSIPSGPAPREAQLGFAAAGSTEFEGTNLKACYELKNRGGAASSSAQLKTALRSKQGTVVSKNTSIPALASGAQTEVCVELPNIPGGPLYTEITPTTKNSGEYDIVASIVGAPSDGSTATIKVFDLTYRVGTL